LIPFSIFILTISCIYIYIKDAKYVVEFTVNYAMSIFLLDMYILLIITVLSLIHIVLHKTNRN